MILQLISPQEVLEYEYWQNLKPPAVIASTDGRVWVRGANSAIDDHRYYEQLGFELVSQHSLTTKKPTANRTK